MSNGTALRVIGADGWEIHCRAVAEAETEIVTCDVEDLASALGGRLEFAPGYKDFGFRWALTVNGHQVGAWPEAGQRRTRGRLARVVAACGYEWECQGNIITLCSGDEGVSLMHQIDLSLIEEVSSNPQDGMLISWSQFEELPPDFREDKTAELFEHECSSMLQWMQPGMRERAAPHPRQGVLTSADLAHLLAMMNPYSSSRIRDRAMLMLMARGGFDVTPISRLQVSDLTVEPRPLLVDHTRTRRDAVAIDGVWLDTMAAAALWRWVAVRMSLGIADEGPLFCTFSKGMATGFGRGQELVQGRPIHVSQIRKTIRRLGEKAGFAHVTGTDITRVPLRDHNSRRGRLRQGETQLIDWIPRRNPEGSTPVPAASLEAERQVVVLPHLQGAKIRRNLMAWLQAAEGRGEKPPPDSLIAEAASCPDDLLSELAEGWLQMESQIAPGLPLAVEFGPELGFGKPRRSVELDRLSKVVEDYQLEKLRDPELMIYLVSMLDMGSV